jgi:hypothetical protein
MFSPDGRRMVVSVNGGLVVVDLSSGSARALGTTGVFPSWSRDGSRIAFLIPVPRVDAIGPDVEVAVVAVDGGAVRRLGVLDHAHQSVEWSADGSLLLVPQQTGVLVLDVASGRITRTLALFAGPAPSFAHWRTGTPQLAVALFGCADSRNLVALDRADAPVRTLVETTGRGEQCLVVHDPRWNPIANELLYVATPMNELCCRAHVLDIPSGKDAVLPLEAYQATWTADGTEIVYMTPWRGAPATTYVRVWPRDGRPDREVLVAHGYEIFVSLASVAY